MGGFQISLEKILAYCRLPEFPADCRVYAESVENEWVHSSPRLLLILGGESTVKYYRAGKPVVDKLPAPVALFTTRDSVVRLGEAADKDVSANQSISFGYHAGYIRANYVDYDGVHLPPTERDVFYHSLKPLSPGGMKLVESMEVLAREGKLREVASLCPLLFRLTLSDLTASAAGPVNNYKLAQQIITYMREHRTEPFSRSDVARFFKISPNYVSKLCRDHVNESFSDLVLRLRLEHSMNLLRKTRSSIDEIAVESGFSCANYFIRRFKQTYGITPHVFRNNPDAGKKEPPPGVEEVNAARGLLIHK